MLPTMKRNRTAAMATLFGLIFATGFAQECASAPDAASHRAKVDAIFGAHMNAELASDLDETMATMSWDRVVNRNFGAPRHRRDLVP